MITSSGDTGVEFRVVLSVTSPASLVRSGVPGRKPSGAGGRVVECRICGLGVPGISSCRVLTRERSRLHCKDYVVFVEVEG